MRALHALLLAFVVLGTAQTGAADWMRRFTEWFPYIYPYGQSITTTGTGWVGLPFVDRPLVLPDISSTKACGKDHAAALYNAQIPSNAAYVTFALDFNGIDDYTSIFVVAAGPQNSTLLWIGGCDSDKQSRMCNLQVKSPIKDNGKSNSTSYPLTPNSPYRITATLTNTTMQVSLGLTDGSMLGSMSTNLPNDLSMYSFTRFGVAIGDSQAANVLCGDNFRVMAYDINKNPTTLVFDDYTSVGISSAKMLPVGNYYKPAPGYYPSGGCSYGQSAAMLSVDLSSEPAFVLRAGMRASSFSATNFRFFFIGPDQNTGTTQSVMSVTLSCQNNGGSPPQGNVAYCGISMRDETSGNQYGYMSLPVYYNTNYNLTARVTGRNIEATFSQDGNPGNNATVTGSGMFASVSNVGFQIEGSTDGNIACLSGFFIDTLAIGASLPTGPNYQWTPVFYENFASETALNGLWRGLPFDQLKPAHFTGNQLCGNDHNILARTDVFDALPVSVAATFSTEGDVTDREIILAGIGNNLIGLGCFNDKRGNCNGGIYDVFGGANIAQAKTPLTLKQFTNYTINGTFATGSVALSIYETLNPSSRIDVSAPVSFALRSVGVVVGMGGARDTCVTSYKIVTPKTTILDNFANQALWATPSALTLPTPIVTQTRGACSDTTSSAVLDFAKLNVTMGGYAIKTHAWIIFRSDEMSSGAGLFARYRDVNNALQTFELSCGQDNGRSYCNFGVHANEYGGGFGGGPVVLNPNFYYKIDATFSEDEVVGSISVLGYSTPLQSVRAYPGRTFVDMGFSVGRITDGKNACVQQLQIETKSFALPPPPAAPSAPGMALSFLDSLTQVTRDNWSSGPVYTAGSALSPVYTNGAACGRNRSAAIIQGQFFSPTNEWETHATLEVFLQDAPGFDQFSAGFIVFAPVAGGADNEGSLITAQLQGSRSQLFNNQGVSIYVGSVGTDTNAANQAPMPGVGSTGTRVKIVVSFSTWGINIQAQAPGWQSGTQLNGNGYPYKTLGIAMSGGACVDNVVIERVTYNNGIQSSSRVFSDDFNSGSGNLFPQPTSSTYQPMFTVNMPFPKSTPGGVCPDIQSLATRNSYVYSTSTTTRVTVAFTFDNSGSVESFIVAAPTNGVNSIAAGIIGFSSSQNGGPVSPISILLHVNDVNLDVHENLRLPVYTGRWYTLDAFFGPFMATLSVYLSDQPNNAQTINLYMGSWASQYKVGLLSGHILDGMGGCMRDFRVETAVASSGVPPATGSSGPVPTVVYSPVPTGKPTYSPAPTGNYSPAPSNSPDVRCLGLALTLVDADADRTILCDRDPNTGEVGCVTVDTLGTVYRVTSLGMDAPVSYDHIARSPNGVEYGVSRRGLHVRSNSSQPWQLRSVWVCNACAPGVNNYLG